MRFAISLAGLSPHNLIIEPITLFFPVQVVFDLPDGSQADQEVGVAGRICK